MALARIRDADGRLRRVTGAARTASAARARLKERLLDRPGFGAGGLLDLSSSFRDLADLWLEDLELRELSDGTKKNYRDDLRLRVRPQFEHISLVEITTGRVEWFLRSESAASFSRAHHSRTVLNQLFAFALRHDAMPRNPVQGTSPLRRPKGERHTLNIEQIGAIRDAASRWRTGPGVKGPKPDGQVRDIIEVLLGTALRIGECLALRVCDVDDGPNGMTISVTGTVVLRTGSGAVRQDHPKTEHSIRRIAAPDFAAAVLRARLAGIPTSDPQRTIGREERIGDN
ncbi:phage integrase central domain-containing protein [Microbacterium aurantiacum]|uniref:phage integrase central domain-containing protein n=1 Tax=Microbacterium aurantiacum TaxID=162393 RepID=UPI003F49244A